MEKARLKNFLTGVGIMGLIGALIVINGLWAATHCGQLRAPTLGQPAPEFSLPTPQGERVSLAGLRGQVLLLAFWASWCDACMRKMPLLERMQVELGKKGLRILAVNIEGNAPAVQRFKQRRRSPLTMLVDNGQLAARYGVQVLPHLALIDREGKIAHVQVGARGDDKLRARVGQALQH